MKIISKVRNNSMALFREILRYKYSPLKTCRNWIVAYTQHLFSALEIRRYGLADPIKGSGRSRCYVSKEMADRFYCKYNPQESIPNISNKFTFASMCLLKKFPTPRTFGVYINGELKLANGICHRSTEELNKFVKYQLPNECLIKPNDGMLGKGLSVFNKNDAGQIIYQDKMLTTEEFSFKIKELEDNNAKLYSNHECTYQGLLFQERLENHPGITKLTGFRMLQTVRICTFVTAENKVEILFCFIKLAGHEGLADGFDLGKSGNMLASIDLFSGKTNKAYSMDLKNNYFIESQKHPSTGASLDDFIVPFWDDCLELANNMALGFVPLRAVGWDIAITDSGPVALEGNGNWVPLVPFYAEYEKLKSYGLKN